MIETKNAIKAIDRLRSYTTKPIIQKDIRELASDPVYYSASSYLGATLNTPEFIIIYLSDKYPEASFVHEILHIILDYEGFPNVSINEGFARRNLPSQLINVLPKLQSNLSSTIDHPEVYRRIESDYNLDLEAYYEIEFQQKVNRFNKMISISKSNEQYYFFRQQDILIGLDYFLWRDHGEKLLKLFRKYYPDAYSSCLSLFKKISKSGFKTPKQSYQSAKAIKMHLINYGKKMLLKKKYNDLWKALEIKLDKSKNSQNGG
jgi:hypothetical protein